MRWHKNNDDPPPSAFPIPASGGDVGSNVGGSGNNNIYRTIKKTIRKLRLYKFIRVA